MKDFELRPDEKEMIAAVRNALDPNQIQRARLVRGFAAKLASGVAAPLLVSSTAMATVLKIGAGILVTAVIGTGVAYVATARLDREAVKPVTTTVHQPKPAPAPSPELTPAPPAVAAVAPVPSDTREAPVHARPVVRHRDVTPVPDLTGELELLTRINAATRAGDANRAFELLHAYDRAYPAGTLAQERAAAGILAHCAAGQVTAARDEARQFFDRWPRSPLVPRIRSSCSENGLR